MDYKKSLFILGLVISVLILSFSFLSENLCKTLIFASAASGNSWSDDFNDGNYDGWTVTRGSFSVASGILNGESNQFNFMHYESSVANGEWEWRVYFIGTGTTQIAFIGLDQNPNDYYICRKGYAVQLTADGLFLERRDSEDNSPDFGTANLATYDFSPQANTWYTIKVVRDTNNAFSVYLDDILRLEATDSIYTSSECFQINWFEKQKFWLTVTDNPAPRNWSDDFNDNDYDGWTPTRGSFSATSGILNGDSSTWNWMHYTSALAYGEWEWRVQYGGSDAAAVCFIGLDQDAGDYYLCDNGYEINFNPSGMILRRLDDDSSETDLDAYSFSPSASTWYTIKVIRLENNAFKVYLDDVLRLEATDSTYTTSEVLQLVWYNHQQLDWITASKLKSWSDDFNDGDYNFWSPTNGRFSVTSGILNGEEPEHNWMHRESVLAYGEWEWKVRYKGSDSAQINIIVIDQHPRENYRCRKGYGIVLNHQQGLVLRRYDGGTSETDLVTYSFSPQADTWYRVRVIREADNTFRVYLNGALRLETT